MIKHRPQICDQSKRRFSPISPGIVQIQQPTDLLNFDEPLSQNTLWQPSDPSQMFRSSAFKSNVHKGYLEQQRLSKPKSFSNLSASVLFLTDRPMADRQLRLYSAGLPLYSGLLPKQQGSKKQAWHTINMQLDQLVRFVFMNHPSILGPDCSEAPPKKGASQCVQEGQARQCLLLKRSTTWNQEQGPAQVAESQAPG